MKKFLSLVLALIMTMSLVTISAGATEYKDLTDKDEIQYEEAVAVLNRIGVITGYDDGSFRPETELTRGAAAKIIVSLLIGPEAASNLPNTYAPYPDVPANHTFAGVISYCKTAGIISGYGDGTFKPANSLTGYAFAKMLLGAIGYDSKIQGYTDTGWTMNVARDGNMAGLFNRIEFDGAAAVNREQACQLALNTLKATMVEYTGGLSVTAGDAHVTTNPTLTYKISNQSYATNISNRKASNIGNANVDNHYTVEFGEEHFKDLRLNDEHGTKYSTDKDGKTILNVARDEFGRPSNKWSFKKVTIGTFPIQPDYVYTERVIHRQDEKVTDASKVRALELSGFNLQTDDLESRVINTTLWVNGVEEPVTLGKVADIADWTDNGTTVEVYISEDDSDFIQDVVVIKTQLMEIKNVKSEAVSLKLYDDGSDNTDGDGIDGKEGVIGFNSRPLDKKVNDVEVNDECYKTLSGMKVGDIVAVIPVAPEHENEEKFDVSRVYAPETVSGELTWVDTYGTEKDAATGIAVTVGGTDYNVALWNKDLTDIDGTSIRVTRKDVTLYLDEFGNALLAKNVGSTSDYMVIGGYHSGLVDGKVVTYADGWDIKGNEISLNIGNARYDQIGGDAQTRANFPIGSLVHYSSSTTSKYAEWKLDEQGVFDVASKRTGETNPYTVKASNSRLVLNDYWDDVDHKAYNNAANDYYSKTNDGAAAYNDKLNDNVYVDDSGVKVIYLTMGDDGEVDSVEVKSGMQNISTEEILGTKSDFADSVKRAQACVGLKKDAVTADSLVKAIVVKLESGNADLKDLVYISRYLGSAGKAPGADNTQRPVYGYEAHFVGTDDWADEVTIYSYQALDKGDFARARKPATVPEGVKNVSEENFYALTEYVKTLKALSTMQTGEIVLGDKTGYNIQGNKTLIKLTNYAPSATNFSKAWPGEDKLNELDLGDQGIIDILSLRGAKIIDLTRHEIQSTSELVDELKELNKDNLSLKVSALYNDDKDSDGFRDVHVLIITDEVKGSGDTVEPPVSTGLVRFIDGYNTNGKYGTIKNGSIVVDKWGDAPMTFSLSKPSWVYHAADGSREATITYDIYVNGEPMVHNAEMYAGDKGAAYMLTANGTNNANTTEFLCNWYLNDSSTGLVSNLGRALKPTDKVEVEITKIDWSYVAVNYVYAADGSKVATVPNTTLYVSNDGARKWDTVNNRSKVGFTLGAAAPANGKYTLSGVKTGDGIAESTWKDVPFTGAQGWVAMDVTQLKDNAITVTITPDAGYVTQYPVTILGNAAHYEAYIKDIATGLPADFPTSDTGKISISADSYAVDEGKDVTFTFAGDRLAGGSALIWAYDVSCKINGKTEGTRLDPKGLQSTVVWNVAVNGVTGPVEVTDLKVTPVMVDLYTTDVDVDETTNTITVTFNKELKPNVVDRANVTWDADNNAVAALDPADSVTASGFKLTFKAKDAIQDNATLIVDAAVFLKDTSTRNKAVKITVTDVSEGEATFVHNW